MVGADRSVKKRQRDSRKRQSVGQCRMQTRTPRNDLDQAGEQQWQHSTRGVSMPVKDMVSVSALKIVPALEMGSASVKDMLRVSVSHSNLGT